MVVTTGFFDGVHLGHRKVIGALVGAAQKRGTESVVITFWPHPRTVLQNDARTLRLLSSLEEKTRDLKALGVDRVEVIPFTREFSTLSASRYLSDYVIGRYGADALVLGYDNRFGCSGGSGEDIEKEASSLGIEIIRPGVLNVGEIAVSSTIIRKALVSGRVADASSMLGYDYSLTGVVVSGNRIGRTIDFPTANMQLYEPLKLVPANGVYKTEVYTLGKYYKGITNIGVRPTVGTCNALTIETHILDFNEEIYGLDIRLSFLDKIRDEIKFNSLDLLKQQLVKDRQVWKMK